MRQCILAAALAAATMVAGASLGLPAMAQAGASAEAGQLSEDIVRALQEALNGQGIVLPVDGVLTEQTQTAIRQYQSQHHLPVTGEPDAATLEKLGVGGPRSEAAGIASQTGEGAAGMAGMGMGGGTTTPQGMMGPQGMTGPQGMMGPGMMAGRGQMPGMMGAAPGQMPMMGGAVALPGGMTICPMMAGCPMMVGCPMVTGTTGMQPGMSVPAPGHSPMGMGGGLMNRGFGVVRPSRHLSLDDVRHHFEHRSTWTGNPRLTLGDVTEADESTIVAEIVTLDGSLVDRLKVDRHTGVIRRAE